MSFKEFMVNINNNIHTNKNQVSFGGIKKLQNNYGFAKHKFFFLYDSDKYDAAVEIFAVERNSKDGNYEVKDKKPISVIGLDAKGNSPEVDLVAFSNDENRNTIAYRYVLTDRNNPSDKKYAFDPGVVIGGNIVSNYADNYPDSDINRTDNKYNLIFTKSPIINKSGPMQLIMPDEYFPGVEMKDGKTTVNQALRNTALSTVRTHINKFGGGFLGIIHKLDDLEKEGYSRIVGMPLTKDTVSSHLYWTQNAYQLAPQLGSYEIKNGNKVPREAMKDYRLFQQELFKHGIDWVSDAALVNEGLQGIHFSNLLRHGVEDSPYKYWFKNDKEKVLGIIPQFSTDTRVKFVNSKLTIRTDESGKKQIVNNPDYDSKSPTYIQLYDARLVSKEQENDDTKIISTYDKNNSHVLEANDKKDSAVRVNPDSYDVKKHDDMVYPYYFAVDPDVLEENIKRAQKDLGSEFDITTVKSIKETLKFPNFKIDTKNKTAGFELWDGNVDIAKLNFYIGNQDQEKINNLPEEERLAEMAKMQRSVYNVQDYAITSGKYWTELTRDLQMAYCAKQFEGIEPTKSGVEKAIKTLVRENKLPKSVAEVMNGTLIENVVNGKYVFPKLNSVDVRSDVNPESKTKGNKYTVSDFILRNAMDFPLEAVPAANDVKKHDDMVYPYYFAVDPDVLEENIKRAQKDLGSEFDITTVKSIKETLKFPNFKIDTKNKTAGFELWDGNVDIAKLNFYIGNQDQEKINNLPEEERLAEMAKMQRSVYNVQDYAITSGKYWTELTRDLQMAYCAKQFEGIEPTKSGVEKAIKTLVRENKLPKSVAEVMNGTLIENVVNGKYVFPKLNSVDVRSDVNPESKTKGNKYTVSDFILRNAMDFPLEAVPAANDVSGVLGSPIISKKANTNEEIGVSRYDIMIAGDKNVPKEYKGAYSEMNELYTSTIAPKIQYIINEAGLSGRVTEGENVSDLGKYILSEITPELTQYLFVKGLKPDAEIRIDEQGYFDYSNVKTEDINLNALGITRYGTPDSVTEAKELVKVIKKGINSISQDELNDIASVVGKRFKNSNLLSYRLADVIMDKTESGMGWRIDAAKDIASLDAVREGFDSFEDAWNSVINFWGKYRENVSSVNPHAYTAAEITDLNTFFKEGAVGRFNDESDATRKFLMETGITTIANYEYLYSLLPQMYTLNDVESGGGNDKAKHSENAELREKFDKAWSQNPGFMFQGPIDSVIKSYTFLGNHDKPRVMHFLALDMGVFHGKFGGNNKIVTDVLQKSEAQIDWASVKGPAIAMGLRINQAIDDKTLNLDEKTKTALKKSVAEIAGGRFKGKDINPEFFGVRPFEIAIANVFEQADYKKRLNMTQEQKDKVQAQLLRSILEPAFDRFYTMYKSMITLPGNITDFAGDKLGASGFETPSKNVYQQNRNPIRWEWLEDKSGNYDFIKEFYKKTNDIIAMRSRPELSALNDGVPITLPQYGNYDSKNQDDKKQFNKHFQAIMRYNDKGSVVITLYNSSGSNVSNTEKLNRAPKSTLEWEGYGRNSYIALSNVNADAKQSIKAGLKPGTRFYNAREDANNPAAYYEVTVGKNGDYKLEGRTKDGKPCDIVVEDKDFNALVLYKKD